MTAADKIAWARAVLNGRKWRSDEKGLRDTVAALADLADAQAQEVARLRGCFERIERAALHGCLTPDLVAQITRAALGDTP